MQIYVKQVTYAKVNHLEPVPCFRDLLKVAYTGQANKKMNEFEQSKSMVIAYIEKHITQLGHSSVEAPRLEQLIGYLKTLVKTSELQTIGAVITEWKEKSSGKRLAQDRNKFFNKTEGKTSTDPFVDDLIAEFSNNSEDKKARIPIQLT